MVKKKNKPNKVKNPQVQPPEPLNGYLNEIFSYYGKSKKYICGICPPGENTLAKKNINRHILKNTTHRNKTPADQIPLLDKQIAEIEANTENIRSKKEKNSESAVLKRNYLEFLTFCYKCNFSFSLTTQLLQFLKPMAISNKLKFLNSFSFHKEEVSKISNELGNCLLEELKEDLSNSPYSLSVDNVTAHGTSICGLKVRYLKEYEESFKGPNGLQATITRRKIENKIIGIKYLKGESTAQVILDIAKEKLLELDPKVKNNMVGFTHDRHSSFRGKFNGLSVLFSRELSQKIFDLPDPCHALSNCPSKSLPSVPEEMLKFTTKIHSYFSSSQRKERLKISQKEGNLDILLLKKYVESRWLSLGDSLERLLLLWRLWIKSII